MVRVQCERGAKGIQGASIQNGALMSPNLNLGITFHSESMPCKQPDLERAAHSRNSALSQSLFSAVEFVRICSANMIPAQSTYCEIAERAELASFVHFCI